MIDQSLPAQLDAFRTFLHRAEYKADSPLLKQCRDFLERFPRRLTDEEAAEFRLLISKAFHLPEGVDSLSGISVRSDASTPQEPFDPLVPRTGWFRKYYEYTLPSEPPTVFHFACAYTALGAVLERNVYFDKGFYKVFPNVAAVLIAPTGKCRKTSAMATALSLTRGVGTAVLSERVTPEALVEGLKGRENAAGLLAAPELAVLLGRQKYLEGMVPLLTALFDAPDRWASTTIGRGETHLANVALSFLGASTSEWFLEALPKEAFSGGFMSRILFIVQEDTPRRFALPARQPGHLYEALREELLEFKQTKGEAILKPEAKTWFVDWYDQHSRTPAADDKFAGYHERKPDHILRMAYMLRLAGAHSLEVKTEDFENSLRILDWIETSLPRIFATVTGTSVGALHQRVINELEKAGGALPHSALLRRLQSYLNAKQLYEVIATLKESETIVEERTNVSRVYKLIRR